MLAGTGWLGDEHGNMCLMQDLLGDAPKEEAPQSTAAVRRDDDRVGGELFDMFRDATRDVVCWIRVNVTVDVDRGRCGPLLLYEGSQVMLGAGLAG